MNEKLKIILSNAALFLLSSTICFFFLEITVRYINKIPLSQFENYIASSIDIVRANTGLMKFDDRLGWKLMNNLGDAGSGMTTNNNGIRMNNATRVDVQKGAILAVGDSFTAGSGLLNNETWPALLEQKLKYPVANGGVGAYGVDQIILRAEELIPLLNPKVVVVGILAQDSFRNSYDVYGGGSKPWFNPTSENLVLKGVPVKQVYGSNNGLTISKSIFGYSYFIHWVMSRPALKKYWIDHDSSYHRVLTDKEGVQVSCLLMSRLNELAKINAFKPIVLMLWGAQESANPKPEWYGENVRSCALEQGIMVLDTHPILNRIYSEDPKLFETLWINEGGVLGHPSKAGNEIVVNNLIPLLSGFK